MAVIMDMNGYRASKILIGVDLNIVEKIGEND